MDEERESFTISYIYYENKILIGFYLVEGDMVDKYFYRRDEFQNIIGIIDKYGHDYGNYIYDPWGNLVGQNIFSNNPIRYKGYYYDEETGLYYLNSRYYDPSIGRFISPDSVDYLDPESINGLNLYAYCGNDPVNYVDPSGHIAILTLIFAALIGGAISVGTAYGVDVVTNFSDGFEWSDFNTFSKENLIKYACAFAGGAISGAIGAFGSTSLQLLGTFVGEMVENAYTFTSWENVGTAIIMGVFSTTLDGVLTVSKNRLTKSYFNKGRSNLSKKDNKKVNKFLIKELIQLIYMLLI